MKLVYYSSFLKCLHSTRHNFLYYFLLASKDFFQQKFRVVLQFFLSKYQDAKETIYIQKSFQTNYFCPFKY